jgi:hypothetical protein
MSASINRLPFGAPLDADMFDEWVDTGSRDVVKSLKGPSNRDEWMRRHLVATADATAVSENCTLAGQPQGTAEVSEANSQSVCVSAFISTSHSHETVHI